MNTSWPFTASPIAVALASALSLSAMTISAQASAAEPNDNDNKLEVIMVTSQKRVQNVKEVPVSVSAISQEKLLDYNISDAEELSVYIANLNISETSQGFNVFLRGLGSGPNQGFEQTVGTYVDGVYRGRAHLMRSAFLDLERVEVLRGPQSALFGRNTTAGAMNLTTAKPTDDFTGYLNAAYDFNFNGTTIEGAVSNGLADNLQGRFAFKLRDGGGFIENTLSDQDEVDHQTFLGRLTLAWQPSDDWNVTLTAQHDKDDLTGFTASQAFVDPAVAASGHPMLQVLQDVTIDDKTHKANPAIGEQEQADFEATHLTLTAEYDMGNVVFTSITGWQDYTLKQSDDSDHSALALIYRPDNTEEFDQISQEFRVTSALEGPFNYIAGFYYQTSNLTYNEDALVYPLNVIGDRHYTADSDTWAVFSQLEYEFNEAWQAILGLRYSSEDKDGTRQLVAVDPITRTPVVDMPVIQAPVIAAQYPNGLPGAIYSQVVLASQNLIDHNLTGSRTENEFSPSFTLRYKLDNMMFYGLVSTGAKAGGFDSRANNPNDFEFEDEQVTSYEVGAKFTLDDGAADLNIALFSMSFEDLQTSVFDGSTGFFVQNGAEATSTGLELDGRWNFADNWMLSGSVGWLDFEWDEFTGAKCFSAVSKTPDNVEANGISCDFSGKTNAFAPEYSGSLSLEYFTELAEGYELKSSLDMIYKSDYYTNSDLNPFTQQAAYTKLNARASLININDDWQLSLLAKNLTDETTINYSTDMALAGPGFYAVWVEPGRSVSLQLSYQF